MATSTIITITIDITTIIDAMGDRPSLASLTYHRHGRCALARAETPYSGCGSVMFAHQKLLQFYVSHKNGEVVMKLMVSSF